jgi:hypothetical protein
MVTAVRALWPLVYFLCIPAVKREEVIGEDMSDMR